MTDALFLPTTPEELAGRGWDRLDVILVTGDSYIDSPYIGAAVIGRVLEQAGLRENTLIVFSSDNGGPNPGALSTNGDLRAGKGTIFEGGVRVCAFANWPGHIPAGRTSGALLGHVDTLATFAALTHQKLPADAAPDSFAAIPLYASVKRPSSLAAVS